MVDESKSDVGIVDVSRVEVPKALLLNIPSPILRLMSVLDTFILMSEVRTSSVWDSVCETLGGMTLVLLGMHVDVGSLKLVNVSKLDTFTFAP